MAITVFNSTTFRPVVMGHHPFHSTVCACDVNQHSRDDCRLDPAIKAHHCEIILAILLLAPGQNFLFCSGVPQLDCTIVAPGRLPLSVGREGQQRDSVRMAFECEQLLAGGGVPQLVCGRSLLRNMDELESITDRLSGRNAKAN